MPQSVPAPRSAPADARPTPYDERDVSRTATCSGRLLRLPASVRLLGPLGPSARLRGAVGATLPASATLPAPGRDAGSAVWLTAAAALPPVAPVICAAAGAPVASRCSSPGRGRR